MTPRPTLGQRDKDLGNCRCRPLRGDGASPADSRRRREEGARRKSAGTKPPMENPNTFQFILLWDSTPRRIAQSEATGDERMEMRQTKPIPGLSSCRSMLYGAHPDRALPEASPPCHYPPGSCVQRGFAGSEVRRRVGRRFDCRVGSPYHVPALDGRGLSAGLSHLFLQRAEQ